MFYTLKTICAFTFYRYPTGLEYKSVCLELVKKYPVLSDKDAKSPVICKLLLQLLVSGIKVIRILSFPDGMWLFMR